MDKSLTAQKRVLIVEDDLSLRPFWEFVLERHFQNYHLEWAVDSDSAKSIYLMTLSQGQNFSMIVLDLFLSGSETGLDFLDLLDHFEESCPVLFVSSVNDEHLKKELRDFHLSIEVFKKPLNVPRLDKVLEQTDVMASASRVRVC